MWTPKINISDDDWIDVIEIAFLARKCSDTQNIVLIYSHLEGQSKEEVNFGQFIRYVPPAILDCIRVAFGNPESMTSLQQKIFERYYLYALLGLYQNVLERTEVYFQINIVLCAKSSRMVYGIRC